MSSGGRFMRKAPRFMNARQKFMNLPPKFTNLRQKFMNIRAKFMNPRKMLMNLRPKFMNPRQKFVNISPKFMNSRQKFMNFSQKFMNIGPVIAGKVAIFAHFWSPIRKRAEKAPFSGRFSRSIRFSDKDGFFGPPRNDPVFPKGARTPVTDFRKERKDGAAPDAFSKPA